MRKRKIACDADNPISCRVFWGAGKNILLFLKFSFAFQRKRSISTVSALPLRMETPWVVVGQENVESGHPGQAALPTPTQQSSGQPRGAAGAAPSPQGVSLQAAVHLIKCSHSFWELLICVSALLLRKGAAASLVAFCYRKGKKTLNTPSAQTWLKMLKFSGHQLFTSRIKMYSQWNNKKHKEMASGGQHILLYLTTHLQSHPPTSSAGSDCHEYSLPADPDTPKPKT